MASAPANCPKTAAISLHIEIDFASRLDGPGRSNLLVGSHDPFLAGSRCNPEKNEGSFNKLIISITSRHSHTASRERTRNRRVLTTDPNTIMSHSDVCLQKRICRSSFLKWMEFSN